MMKSPNPALKYDRYRPSEVTGERESGFMSSSTKIDYIPELWSALTKGLNRLMAIAPINALYACVEV